MKISKKIMRIMSLALTTTLLVVLFSAATVQAAASIGIAISGNTEVGSTITVNITASGDGPYSGYDGSISYDSSQLQLLSIVQGNYPKANFSSSGSSFLDSNANIPNGGILVTATFKCILAGSSNISCSLGDIADMNVNPVTVSGASKAITITAPVPKSSNTDLSSLAVSPGTLSPKFATGTLSYTATVEANQSKIAVSAAPSDSKSKVSLNGVQNKLVSGSNTVKITVTAENGATKVYTIAVTRSVGPTPTPTPTPVPLPLMRYNTTDYTILKAGSTDTIPDGFTTPSTASYKGVEIPVLQKTLGQADDASVMNIVLLTANGQTSFFVYDPATETCYPYQVISSSVSSYQILDKSAAASIPAGYEEFEYTYNGGTVSAYRLISDPSNPQIMLYLLDASGISAFYYYDTQNQMLMLYRGDVAIVASTTTPTPTPDEFVTLTPVPTTAESITTPTLPGRITIHSLSDYTNPIVLVIYLLVILCVILLVVCITLIVKRSRLYDNEDYDDYEEYEDENMEDNSFEDSNENVNEIPPKQKYSTSDSPFVAKQPESFFSEFGQPGRALNQTGSVPVQPSAMPVQPVNKPMQPVNRPVQPFGLPEQPNQSGNRKGQPEVKLLFGDSPQGKMVSDTKEEHVPVRLRHDLEAELTQRKPDHPPVPKQPKHKLPSNDPDYDPDDE